MNNKKLQLGGDGSIVYDKIMSIMGLESSSYGDDIRKSETYCGENTLIKKNPIVSNYDGNILFVMIGNMVTISDSVAHWEQFIKNSDEKLHLVIHPQQLSMTSDIRTKWEHLFKKKENLMICDEEHWVKTAWGNISLSFATLMAIEYAMKNKSYNYYKKIVFLQQCLPLYNFNIIKNELVNDNKSWFKPREGNYPGWEYSKPYDFNRKNNDGATINDWNWWNAVFAIDYSHFNIFFDEKNINEDNNYTGTYVKNGQYSCNGVDYDNVNPIKTGKYNVLFEQTTGSWDWDNPSKNSSCINSDEVFFGLGFKTFFKGNSVTEQSRVINLDVLDSLYKKNIVDLYNIHKHDSSIYVYLFDEEDKQIIKDFKNFGNNSEYPKLKKHKINELNKDMYVYLPRIVWLDSELYKDDNYPVYIGINTNYNPEKLKEYYIINKNDEQKYTYFKHGKVEQIDENIDPKFSENGVREYKVKNTIDDVNQFTNKNIYDQSVTYHDWTSFPLNPDNIFRDAIFTTYDDDNKCKGEDKITKHLNNDINTLLNDIKNKKFRMNSGKLPIWHPMEYFTLNLKTLINSYNVMILCILCKNNMISPDTQILTGGNHNYASHNETHNYFNLIKIIKFVWRRCILLFEDYVEENKTDLTFKFKDDIPSNTLNVLENMKIGTSFTEDILSSALVNGSLFIRKGLGGSNILKYTDALYNIDDYIPNKNIVKYKDKENFGEFLYIPESIFTWEFYRKNKSNLCSKLNPYDIAKINDKTKLEINDTDNSVVIDDVIFKYKKLFAKGTNEVLLFESSDGKNIMVKRAAKINSLEEDLIGANLLKDKKYKNNFIDSIEINKENIILEMFDNTASELIADYVYKNLLTTTEYYKIIKYVVDTYYEMSLDGLYYIDLKTHNILYKCSDNTSKKLKIKFGDIGSISSTKKNLSFPEPRKEKYSEQRKYDDKNIVWPVGIFILQLIGGIYLNQKEYQDTNKKNTHFDEYINNIKQISLKNIKLYFKNDIFIEFINKLLGYNDGDIFTIKDMYDEMNKINEINKINEESKTPQTGGKFGKYEQKYIKYKQKYLALKNNKY